MKKRPTSPHLGIYKPMITSVSSILGRFAGIYLYLISSVLLVLMAFAIQKYRNVGIVLDLSGKFYNSGVASALILVVFIFISLFAFFLYLLAVIRHLLWDFGYCLELKTSKILGYAMFILAFLFSASTTIYMFYI
jgi:succinate dehydrogenase / fumarate reductase cytochrome b subunit